MDRKPTIPSITGENDYIDRYYNGPLNRIRQNEYLIEPMDIEESGELGVKISGEAADPLVPSILSSESKSTPAYLTPNDDRGRPRRGHVTLEYGLDSAVRAEGIDRFARDSVNRPQDSINEPGDSYDRINQSGLLASFDMPIIME